MELAILFWCYKEVDICTNRLRLLRHYNPATPIYVLFGGSLAEAQKFEAEFLPYVDDFYVFPEQRSPQWKWQHGDMLISRWFEHRGHQLKWDSITVMQWDMLAFAPVERLFRHLEKGQLLLPDVRPAEEVKDSCYWLMPQCEFYCDYEDFLGKYDLTKQDAWYGPLIVAAFPRAFLERFAQRKHPEIGFLEYTIPTLAKRWGFDFCTQHPYRQWYTGPIFCKDNPHPYDKMLNSVQEECQDRYVLLHLLDPAGLRIFHPYFRDVSAEKFSPVLPAWLNFLRCKDWDYADLLGDSTRALVRHAIAGYDLALPDPVTTRPAICLSMLVRNAAHLIQQVLDTAAPHISSWVIVDTGSDDGTSALIVDHMARLGVPGELYHRPWRNIGHNRAEALALAQDHGDYVWILDAQDTVVGLPDFTRLGAEVYWLRCRDDTGATFWCAQLFRDGLRVRYEGGDGYVAGDDETVSVGVRLAGDYHIESGRFNARNANPVQKYARDRDLLLAELERAPQDARLVFHLAQSYFALGDFGNARTWYARLVELLTGLAGWEEQVYIGMWRLAESMQGMGLPWSEVQDAFLRAWEFRPTRAEALYAIARSYREKQRYVLGYQFAKLASEIAFPHADRIFVGADVYAWRAADERAVCASWTNRHAEAFALWRRLLARPDIPDADRQRMAANRDVCVPAVLDAASSYPQALVQTLVATSGEAGVFVSLVAGPDRTSTEQTLNSFLNCCTDVRRVGRFLVLDVGLSAQDRATLVQRYGFLEFTDPGPVAGIGERDAQLAQLRAHVDGRYWLHLGQGWRFFAPENLITRLIAVLQAEPQLFQVGINFADGSTLTGACAAEPVVSRAPDTGRYVCTDVVASGPAMFDTARLDQRGTKTTGSLDEVLCIAAT